MIDQESRMIEAQARIISQLRKDHADLQASLAETTAKLAHLQQAAEFYFELQKEILDNPILQSEWARFCSFLKMANPEMDKRTPRKSSRPEEAGYTIPFMF